MILIAALRSKHLIMVLTAGFSYSLLAQPISSHRSGSPPTGRGDTVASSDQRKSAGRNVKPAEEDVEERDRRLRCLEREEAKMGWPILSSDYNVIDRKCGHSR